MTRLGTCLISALLCLAFGTFAAGDNLPSAKEAKGQALLSQALSTCETRFQKILYLPLEKLRDPKTGAYVRDRIHESTELGDAFSSDYHLLLTEIGIHTQGLSDADRADCQALASSLRFQLESFFERRFALLLRQGNLGGFCTEYQTLLSRWIKRADRRRIAERFGEAQSAAMTLAFTELEADLKDTRWESYGALSPTFANWSEEWSRILGGDMRGGVLFDSRQIAIQVGELDDVSIKLILFHELSHLADPRLLDSPKRTQLTRYETELYAWQQTFEYVELLKAQGRSVPGSFVRAQAHVKEYGLENWVSGIVRSLDPTQKRPAPL